MHASFWHVLEETCGQSIEGGRCVDWTKAESTFDTLHRYAARRAYTYVYTLAPKQQAIYDDLIKYTRADHAPLPTKDQARQIVRLVCARHSIWKTYGEQLLQVVASCILDPTPTQKYFLKHCVNRLLNLVWDDAAVFFCVDQIANHFDFFPWT